VGAAADDTQAIPLVASYAAAESDYYKERDKYFVKILKLALEHSGRKLTLEAVDLPQLKESRTRLYLSAGRYNVHWLVTNRELEEEFIPIRIPLYKGLIGWRVFFVREGSADLINRNLSLESLKGLRTAQGHDWPDFQILQANGFKTYKSASWEGLFEMLKRGRIDYLPRSAVEIADEAEAMTALNITIEDDLILRYPLAYYFFVNKSYPDLAKAIQVGLEKLIANGIFEQEFNQRFAKKLTDLHLHSRRIIDIENPYIRNDLLPTNKSLWYQVTSEPPVKSALQD